MTKSSPETARTVALAVRVPERLLRALDAYAQKHAARLPGVEMTRSDAVRMLLSVALVEHVEIGDDSGNGATG